MALRKYILFFKWIIYTAYLFLLPYVVFVGGNDYRRVDLFAFTKRPNFSPFNGKIAFIQYKGIQSHKDIFYFVLEMVGNLLLLFPIPVLLMLGEGKSNAKQILLLSFIISLSIECIQFILDIGQMDIDDVILNTLGAAIGIAFASWIKRKYFWQRISPVILRVSNAEKDDE